MALSTPDAVATDDGSLDTAILAIEASISELIVEFGSEVEEFLRALESDTRDSVTAAGRRIAARGS
jgi:hypothetical protein